MSKIKEVVKLKSGYANFVELKSDFEATKAHRVALESICRGLSDIIHHSKGENEQ